MSGSLLVLAFTLIAEDNSSFLLAGTLDDGLVQTHINCAHNTACLVQPHRQQYLTTGAIGRKPGKPRLQLRRNNQTKVGT